MFTGGMRESSQTSIELKGLSPRGLKHIIDFAYSSELTLDLDCIQDVLGAAVFLQMLPVVELCEKFLESAVSVETCLHIGQLASAFSLASLKRCVDPFTFRHFLQISEQPDFLDLPPDRLVFFLQSNELQSCSELDLFHAAVRWLRHDDAARRPQAGAVLAHVRFPLMHPCELVDSVQTVDLMLEDERCRRFLLEAFAYQILPLRQHAMQTPRTLVRSDVPSLVAFGGTSYDDGDRAVSSKVFRLADALRFEELAETPGGGVSHACVAVMNNFVYVAGGQRLQHRSGEGATDGCHRYDARLNRWLPIAAMLEPRIQFTLTALRGRLYAAGGRNRSGSLAAVERYSPERDEWSAAEPLERRTWGHAAAAAADRLYVTGGYGVSLDDKRSVRCYEPASGAWSPRASMNEPRVLHAMAALRDRVYALGGRAYHADRCFDVLAAEFYVPEADQWTSVSAMRVGQSEAGCCALAGKIYVVGGYNWHLNNVTSTVQVYNADTDQWERDLHFPESFAGVACAAVVLPPR